MRPCDRCCIDKQSSAELSEAINSMYHWYAESAVCYAYLQDVQTLDDVRASRWFRRGWTLQELIAPANVVFLNREWQDLGDKSELGPLIESITGIEAGFLHGDPLAEASIATRMSWASRRETARQEDMAYCLLGIFDINMPLIYGEGPKSFQRLQEEIYKLNPEDHTLYAWGDPVDVQLDHLGDSVEDLPALKATSPSSIETGTNLYGLLARSPKDFANSRYIENSPLPEMYQPAPGSIDSPIPHPSIDAGAIRIGLPRIKSLIYPFRFNSEPIIQQRPATMVWILCSEESPGTERRICCLVVLPWGRTQKYGTWDGARRLSTFPKARTHHLVRVTMPIDYLCDPARLGQNRLEMLKISRAFGSLPPNSIVISSFSYTGQSRWSGSDFDFIPSQEAQEDDYRTFTSNILSYFSVHIKHKRSQSNAVSPVTLVYMDERFAVKTKRMERITDINESGQSGMRLVTELQSDWSLDNGDYAKMRISAHERKFGLFHVWIVDISLFDP